MTIGEFSVGISIAGTIPYITQIIKGEVRPHRVSWFVWTMILALTLWGYRAAGAQDSAWFIAGDLLVTGTIFLLSLWRGKGGYEKLDIICLFVALISMLVWQVFKLPGLVLLGTMLADVMAIVPTVAKALREPETESATTFAASTLAAFCGIVAVGQWNLLLLFYPFYLFLANFVTALVILVSQYQVSRVSALRQQT